MNSSGDGGSNPASDLPSEPMSRPARLIVLLWLLSALVYLGWRSTTLNPIAPIFSSLVYGIEVLSLSFGLLRLFVVHRLSQRPPRLAEAALTVDLLILANGEPLDRIRPCLLAARNIDYPHRTWLLDAGDSAELRDLARELDAHHLPSPAPGTGRNQRLNRALGQSTADYLAIFDADHAPKRSFLDATLGHFRDPQVAFVQTAQDFLSLDPEAADEGAGSPRSGRALFFQVLQRGRDCWNAALYCGSCAVFRRSALATIGGFPPDRPGADLETSLAVHKAGLRSVYIAQPLAFGVAPTSVRSSQPAQRRRDRGARQVLIREALFLRGRLSAAQRLAYLAATLGSLSGWLQVLCYLAPVWLLLSGTLPLSANLALFAALFLPYQLLRLLADEEISRGHGRRRLLAALDLRPFMALVRRERRPAWTPPAAVLPSTEDLPLGSGIRRLWPLMLVAALNLAAIVIGASAWQFGLAGSLPAGGLLAAILWASLNIGIAGLAMQPSIRHPEEQRQARRFAIPMPARITVDGSEIIMTVDNISSTGARLYGDFPNRLKPGDRISGELYLPGDVLPFDSRIAALLKPAKASEDGQYHAALGIAFSWPDRRTADRLDLFLYGSDLHWQFQRSDRYGHTTRERIAALFGRSPVDPLAGKHWAAIRYDIDGEPGHGLISVASSPGPRVVVTGRRLALSEPLQASKFSRRQPQGLRITPRRELAQLSTPTAMLYLTEVKAAPVLESMRSSTSMRYLQQIGAAPS